MERSVHLALGARDGDRMESMRAAVEGLTAAGLAPTAASSLWETEPVDLPPGPTVYNAALRCPLGLPPEEILDLCQGLEEQAGRDREARDGRFLDLDILLAGDHVIRTGRLVLPHPRFHLRRFNLAPLAEIAPGETHPLLGRTVEKLLKECADPAWVRVLRKDWLPGAIERVPALG